MRWDEKVCALRSVDNDCHQLSLSPVPSRLVRLGEEWTARQAAADNGEMEKNHTWGKQQKPTHKKAQKGMESLDLAEIVSWRWCEPPEYIVLISTMRVCVCDEFLLELTVLGALLGARASLLLLEPISRRAEKRSLMWWKAQKQANGPAAAADCATVAGYSFVTSHIYILYTLPGGCAREPRHFYPTHSDCIRNATKLPALLSLAHVLFF